MHYQLFANGAPVTVNQWPCRPYDIKTYAGEIYKHIADEPAFAILTGEESVELTVVPDAAFTEVKIRPLSYGITPVVDDGKITFTLPLGCRISLELDGDLLSPLFVFHSKKTPMPESCDYYYGPGEHDIGIVKLQSNQTIYLEAGAICHGNIDAQNAENVSILGEGILSGVKQHRDPVTQQKKQMIDVIGCKNVKIGAITMYDSPGWMCRVVDSEYVEIDGLRGISMNPSGDGIDICNSRHAHIHNAFMKTNDDTIVIKSLFRFADTPVYDIVAENCVCWSATHGNGLEVGYETCCSEMYDIHFKNCDVIHCEREGYQSGGTLTIHNGDRAVIHHVYFEDIRIEDSHEKIFDLKICNACWSHDETRGQIRDIYFKNIAIVDGPFPPSIIRGFESKSSEFAVKWDDDHTMWVLRDLHDEGTLRDIYIENFTVYGEKKTNFLDAKVVNEIATNVVFK